MKKSIALGSLSALTVGVASIMPMASCSCFNSPETTKTYDFTFNGNNCSINGDKKFTTKVNADTEKVKFTILPDAGYVLPISPELPEGVTIDSKGIVTIAKMISNIEFSLTAEVAPSPEETFTFAFNGTYCSINNQTKFVEEIPVSKQTVQYTILPDLNYKLPDSYPDLPEGVTIDNNGVITISNTTTSVVTVDVTAQPVPITGPIIDDAGVTIKEFDKKFNKNGTIAEFQITGFTYENMTEDEVKSLVVENSFPISTDDTQVSTTIDQSTVTSASFAVKVTITGKSCLPSYSLSSDLSFSLTSGSIIKKSYGYKLNLDPYGMIIDREVFGRDLAADETSLKVITQQFNTSGFDLDNDVLNVAVLWKHQSGSNIVNTNCEGTLNVPASSKKFTIRFELNDMGTGNYTEKGYIQFLFNYDSEWTTPGYTILISYGYTITWSH